MTKKSSFKGKKLYATYKATSAFEKNRKAKLRRHLKRYPNDDVAQKALTLSGTPRKAPNNKLGWVKKDLTQFYGERACPVVAPSELKALAQIQSFSLKVKKQKHVPVDFKKINLNPFQILEQHRHILVAA